MYVRTPLKQASLSLSLNTVPPVRIGLGAYLSQGVNLIEPLRRDRSIKTLRQLFDQNAAGSGFETSCNDGQK